MRIVNKIVIILILLAVMVLVPLILTFPEQAEFGLRYVADVIRANLEWLESLPRTTQIGVRVLLALAGMVVFLVGLLLIILELFRGRRKTVQLKDKGGELMVDSISGHLAYHLDLLPDVLRVRPTVSSSGKSLRTTIHVETPPDVNVPQKSAEVKETARRVIEEQLGVQTKGDIRVIVRPIAYPKISPVEQKRPARTDQPPPSPLPPIEAMIEEEEKRAEPLSPEREELPYLTESYPMADEEPTAVQAVEPQAEDGTWTAQEPEADSFWGDDSSPPQGQEASTDNGDDDTTLDAKGPF
jgi:hypothetical protein